MYCGYCDPPIFGQLQLSYGRGVWSLGGGEVGNKFTRNFSNCYFEFLTARENLDQLSSQRKIGKGRKVDDKFWLQRPKVRSEMGREYDSTVSSSSCPFPLARRRDRGSREKNTQCQPGVEIRIQQLGKNLWWSFCIVLRSYINQIYHPSVVTETVWERRLIGSPPLALAVGWLTKSLTGSESYVSCKVAWKWLVCDQLKNFPDDNPGSREVASV